jgi:hypothetical protein
MSISRRRKMEDLEHRMMMILANPKTVVSRKDLWLNNSDSYNFNDFYHEFNI